MLYAVAEETAAIVRAHRHSRAWRGAPGFHRDSRESTRLCVGAIPYGALGDGMQCRQKCRLPLPTLQIELQQRG